MSHISKKFLIVSVCFFLAIFFVGLYTCSPKVAYAESNSILNTNVQYDSVEKIIDISEEKVCNITEIITVTYKRAGINLGLSRNISRINKITRVVDGKSYVTKTINKFNLLSVLMDDQPEYNFVETDDDYFYINTGRDGDYKQGQHVYKFNYLYDMGEDFIEDFDDFTFDIMDYGFKSQVANFSCQITLPKDFYVDEQQLASMLTFRTNDMRSLSSEAVNLVVTGNTLKMDYQNLPAQNGLTMQLILDNKYFNTSYSPNSMYYVVLAFSILAILGILILIFVSRHHKKVVIIPEFYPPENFSPMDVARVYRGKVKSKDFASLMIYWASKGYVEIEMQGKNVILKKLKDIPAYRKRDDLNKSKSDEKEYFDAIFKDGSIYNTKKEKYKSNTELSLAVQSLYKKTKIKKIVLFRFAIHCLSILPFVLFMIWNSFSLGGGGSMFFLFLFPIIAIMVFIYMPMPLSMIWFKLIWCGGFGGAPLGILLSQSMSVYDVYFLAYIVIAIFLLGNFSVLLVKGISNENLLVRGRILGFKQFLFTAELDRLKMLLEENPEYYYDILPFCYVFGITKKMQKKFSSLNAPYPQYCLGLEPAYFCSHLNHSMGSIGGGFSGSSSGGGSGGGGGGGSSGGGGGGGGCGGR